VNATSSGSCRLYMHMVIRLVVAIIIILPLMLVAGLDRPWYVTFGIAILGFGAGRGVEYLVKKNQTDQV
jgi:hypothetical protein